MTERLTPDHRLTVLPHTPHTDGRALRHPDIIKEQAEICWFETGGNAAKAARCVAQKCAADPTGQLPADPQLFPSREAIRRWAQDAGWDDAFTADVAQRFPQSMARLHARFLALADQIVDGYDELTDPDHVERPGDKTRADLIKHGLVLLGVGTAAAKGAQPQVTVAVAVEPEPEFESAEQANRYWISPKERQRGSGSW